MVVGGTLLTGGYGSVIGPVFGALIFAMVQQGIIITGVDGDWFRVFRGRHPGAGGHLQQLHPTESEQAMSDKILEIQGVSKFFGSVIALQNVSMFVRPGEVTCPPGRQRRRQVDPDQDPGRRPQAQRGQVLLRGRGDSLRVAPRSAQRGHRHRLPGPGDDPPHVDLAELLPGFRTPEGRAVLRHRERQEDHPRGDGQDGDRHPRPRPAGRHPSREASARRWPSPGRCTSAPRS